MAYSPDSSGTAEVACGDFRENSNIQKIITVSETAKSVFQVNSLESKISVLYNWVSPDFIIESGRLSGNKNIPK